MRNSPPSQGRIRETLAELTALGATPAGLGAAASSPLGAGGVTSGADVADALDALSRALEMAADDFQGEQ